MIGNLLGKFNSWSQKRLRVSQIKILYQNQSAIEFLKKEFDTATRAGLGSPEITEGLSAFEHATDSAIISLTYEMALPEHVSRQLLEVNGALKNLYSGYLEGRVRARQQQGAPSGDLVQFADRFRPAAGWDSISDTEWDRVVSRSLGRLKE